MRTRLALVSFVLACMILLTPLISHAHFTPASSSLTQSTLFNPEEAPIPTALNEPIEETSSSDDEDLQEEDDNSAQSPDNDSEQPSPEVEDEDIDNDSQDNDSTVSDDLVSDDDSATSEEDADTKETDDPESDLVTETLPTLPSTSPSLPSADDEIVFITFPSNIPNGDLDSNQANSGQGEEVPEEEKPEELEEELEEELGYTEIWDDEIFQVLLPTSVNFDFILDPHGILFLSEEEILDLDLDPDSNRLGRIIDGVFHPLETAGQIIFPNQGALQIANQGNHPIFLEIDMRLDIENDYENLTFVHDPGEIFSGDEEQHSIFMGATFSSPDLHAASHFASNHLINSETVPVLDTVETHQFILDGAMPLHYSLISPENEIVQVSTAPGFGTVSNMEFHFTGMMNPAADWSILEDSSSLSLSIVFRISGI